MSTQNSGDAQLNKRSEQGLALSTAQSDIATWRDPEWQRLWLAVEARPWRALALIPAGQGALPNFTLVVAVALSRTGMVHLGSPIQVADATRIQLGDLNPFIDEVRRCTRNGDRLLVALPPLEGNPITGSIVQAADAAMLCVQLDRMKTSEAQKTVRQVGASRFIGSAIFHAQGTSPTPQR
ncbi:MAG: hypothetical protein ABUL62_08540 [Myxococcales bacterium]